MIQRVPLEDEIQSFEAVIASYGEPDLSGTVITRQAAVSLLNQLELDSVRIINGVNFRLMGKRIDGNLDRGVCLARFTRVEES